MPIEPPWASMMRLTVARPMPLPSTDVSTRLKRPKTRSRSATEMPIPWSRT